MSLTLDGTSGVTFPNNTVQASAGSVLQVAFSSTSSQIATTSQTLTATNLTGSITPKFATSKVFIQCALPVQWASGGIGVALYKNGSLLFNPSAKDGSSQLYYGYGGAGMYLTMPLNYLDSPASTSSTTYTIYISSYTSGVSTSMPFPGGTTTATATMTLMEIAG